ncbi:hypothetical protein PACTADRAFT_65559 [Pachysolen tannophilus NRRL Y-2460]|uniref:Uncharacterized protein n=1 Tax=Pachysolen tannophilus NRRL Y-2460 TaxID=669874 RepID=A0A1E4TZ15_PACTA|nr:hypothetical protein PACTADRAFT_65559 [Pachysolen tannophilus NRRL Y-2460]
MSSSQRPKVPATSRQEYICKIRYQNDLPAPPCPPKLLKYVTFDSQGSMDSPSLLSSLFRKENFKNLIPFSEQLGMPIDLLTVPGLIDQNDETKLLGNRTMTLHPDDQLLLLDPSLTKISKKQPAVSFLRRTQYIAEKSSISRDTKRKIGHQNRTLVEEATDPTSQLTAVERTFELAAEYENKSDLSGLVHPKKPHLKAKKVWNFLPDVSMMDQTYLSVKFHGSASLSRELIKNSKKPVDKELIETSVFKPIITESDEWMSYYTTTNSEESKSLKRKLDDTKGNLPIDEPDNTAEKYEFNLLKDYDMNFKRFDKNFEELALNFDNSNTCFFLPVNGKIDLKRRRVNENLKQHIQQNDVNKINLKVREPTTNESIQRDTIRSVFDPINYFVQQEEGSIDEEVEGELEGEGEKNEHQEEVGTVEETDQATKEEEAEDNDQMEKVVNDEALDEEKNLDGPGQ